MIRPLFLTLAALFVGTAILLADSYTFYKGKVKKIDFDEMRIILIVDGKDQEFSLSAETRVIGSEAKSLKERMKGIKEGSPIMVAIRGAARSDVVFGIDSKRSVPGGADKPSDIRKAKVKKIDFDKMTVTLTVDGKDQEFTLTEETRILGGEGKSLKERMKDIKAGSAVMFRPMSRGGKEVIQGMKLDDGKGPSPGGATATGGKTSVGYKPLTEMSADDKYKGEDGGLYGGGKNEPPAEHQAAAKKETAKIVPLDADGKPAKDGKIVLISMSMSNATQEFSFFTRIAKDDQDKSPRLTIVDCAQGGQAMAQWAGSDRPWQTAEKRLGDAGVTSKQVQVVWVKLANPGPRGDLAEHGKKLKSDTLKVFQRAKETFPNLRIAYLGSRIYGGYAASQLNPEPYAYEGAFVVRWLIQDQIKGDTELNFDAGKGAVKSPLLLWGPYFWADGVKPRKADGLVWERKDLAGDGTHPSEAGRKKVAELLLKFFKEDALAKSWFVK